MNIPIRNILILLGIPFLGFLIFLGIQQYNQTQSTITPEETLTIPPEESKLLINNQPHTEEPQKIMNTATFTTNFGDFVIKLDTENTPQTAANFIKLAQSGFYNGVRFHRIIKDFMIQGGDPLSKDITQKNLWGTGGPGYQFADEIKPTNNNIIGTISMANAGPNTNGSQFFINTANNNFLDSKHTVFGIVTEGFDIIKKIETTDTEPNDRPVKDVIIQKITIH